jgi:hypothetical protein
MTVQFRKAKENPFLFSFSGVTYNESNNITVSN